MAFYDEDVSDPEDLRSAAAEQRLADVGEKLPKGPKKKLDGERAGSNLDDVAWEWKTKKDEERPPGSAPQHLYQNRIS